MVAKDEGCVQSMNESRISEAEQFLCRVFCPLHQVKIVYPLSLFAFRSATPFAFRSAIRYLLSAICIGHTRLTSASVRPYIETDPFRKSVFPMIALIRYGVPLLDKRFASWMAPMKISIFSTLTP
jgi:hypothetical protein